MKLISFFVALCVAQENDTDFRTRSWEDSVVRAEKAIVLYREVAKKALYCNMMNKRRPKFIFRFRKTVLDVTWHVKNNCNNKRSRRSVSDLPDGDFFFFDKKQAKGKGKGKLVFDYEEFDGEGFNKMDEEVDDVLFDLFIADYVDVTPVLPKPTFSKSARSMVSPLASISSDNQKRVTMVSKAIKTTRKTAYSVVKEFADKCPKSSSWLRRIGAIMKNTRQAFNKCLEVAPNA